MNQPCLVKPINSFISEYSALYDVIKDHIMDDESLSIEEKKTKLRAQLDNLKAEFREARKTEYESKIETKSIGHSCTKPNRGGARRECGKKYLYPTCVDMSVKTYRLEGEAKVISANPGAKSAYIEQFKSGRGRIFGILHVDFHYNPDFIGEQLDYETTYLFNEITE